LPFRVTLYGSAIKGCTKRSFGNATKHLSSVWSWLPQKTSTPIDTKLDHKEALFTTGDPLSEILEHGVFYFALTQGLRIGEMLGLRWSNLTGNGVTSSYRNVRKLVDGSQVTNF
jgi:hypothetical protein